MTTETFMKVRIIRLEAELSGQYQVTLSLVTSKHYHILFGNCYHPVHFLRFWRCHWFCIGV